MVSEIKGDHGFNVTFNALVTTPEGFDPKKESLPIIFFLHGAGERGDDLSYVTRHGIPKYFSADPDYHGLRVITVSPQCPAYTVWNDISIQLFDFIEDTVKKYNADKSKVAISGISMGGFGTWELLISHPDYFAAAVPVCGGGMNWRVPKIKTPIKVFHGTCDDVVPVCYSQYMHDAVNSRGGHAEIKLYPQVGHNSWDLAFEEEGLIEWLAGV